MRKKGLFNKLIKEGRLGLVEPSAEVAGAYLKKSESNLISSKILIKNNRFEEAVSLAYYSMYHMTQALFFKTGIKCENHTATIMLLKKIFEIDAKELSDAKKERVNKQYYVDSSIVKEDAEDLIVTAERFNSNIHDFMERLKRQDIEIFRRKAKQILEG